MSARSMHRTFHGRKIRKKGSVKYSEPNALVYLGRAKRIEYVSDKHHGGGDGLTAVYYHDFGRGVYLYTDENGKQLYILKNGENYKQVTRDGIVS